MVLVPIQDDVFALPHGDVGPYRYLTGSEWILDRQNRRVCWIPVDRRGRGDSHGDKVVLGTKNGRVAILDFSDISVS